MSKILTVIGATGIQGGSVIDALIKDKTYTIRAITRNPQSAAAQKLSERGVQVVQADANTVTSLRAAFEGSHAIFAVTNFFEPLATHGLEKAGEIETAQGINMAKAAADTPTLEHYIWSTLPNAERASGGRAMPYHYATKNKVDDFIKSHPALLAKTTFFWIGFYASDIRYPFWRPMPVQGALVPGLHVQMMPIPASVPVPMAGDAPRNVGLFVEAILRQPEKTRQGRLVALATDSMTMDEVLQTWAKVHGKVSEYVVVDKEAYARMWPVWGEVMNKNFGFLELVGNRALSGDNEEQQVLTKDDLGIEGLIGTADAFASMEV